MDTKNDVTRLLEAWNQGDPEALEKLMPLVVDDLRAIARQYFEREDSDHTLQPTALVNELYMKLNERRTVHWESAWHFFGTAAQMMRLLLVDHARQRHAAKRGRDVPKVVLSAELPVYVQGDPEEILAFDDALRRLEEIEPRKSRIMELKAFAGLTIPEIAGTL
ncbi:MAG: RNA polymerase subunit sigma-70, partial [bacterium]|nr:RNA polymerase subunit sigma-70 [bacterium]